jgi:hypothetical protein
MAEEDFVFECHPEPAIRRNAGEGSYDSPEEA